VISAVVRRMSLHFIVKRLAAHSLDMVEAMAYTM